jgi:hypothetical protein
LSLYCRLACTLQYYINTSYYLIISTVIWIQ